MIDKQPTPESDKSTIKVVDEFSSLIQIYDKNPEDREKIIREYFKNSSRISFGEINLDEYVNLIQDHFKNHTQEYLEDEKSFLLRFSDINLETFIEYPIVKSKNLFPEGLNSPNTIFLLNGNDTDGMVIGDGEFGINLNNFFRTYYDAIQREVDFDSVLRDIQGTVSHEAVHCFCEQLSWRKDQKKGKEKGMVGIAFEEGLATTVQDIYPPHHDRYIKEFDFWKGIIQKTLGKNSPETYYQILGSIKNNKNLNEFNPRAISLIEERFSKGGEIVEKEFDYLITKSVIKLNGPIYHIGSKIWSDIYKDEGLEGVKRRVIEGPKSFEKFFK